MYLQGDGSYDCSDEVTDSDYDMVVDDWMRAARRRRGELSGCSDDAGSRTSQASFRLSDFDRSTFYDYDYDDDDDNAAADVDDASSNSEESRSLQSQPHINEVM